MFALMASAVAQVIGGGGCNDHLLIFRSQKRDWCIIQVETFRLFSYVFSSKKKEGKSGLYGNFFPFRVLCSFLPEAVTVSVEFRRENFILFK
ncbi:hypothetical protein CEXT_751921 [Caerostris extrusa]|uniref:Secreted protein n=1 Tax=Caerostris extrusa TaxID=172846 RepID=A0AAV4TKM9_CAEEX|nr:hypothetical protein CEXT_751921 [Caerostris extrusa]